MPGPIPVDLGRERDDCTARFHGTYNAALKAGCICPRARDAHRRYNRDWYRAWHQRNGRRSAVDPTNVAHAIDRRLTASQLTTAEKVLVVRHLTAVRHMTDREIAMHLRWSGDDIDRGKENVLRFRRHHRIPAGVAPTHNRPIREAAAA